MNRKQKNQRIVIENISTEIDCGRFPIKRCLNELVSVKADIFADGHEQISGELKFRHESCDHWQSIPLSADNNDYWAASFLVTKMGHYYYTISAWTDEFKTWREDLQRWIAAKEDIRVELKRGLDLIHSVIQRANSQDANQLTRYLDEIQENNNLERVIEVALDTQLFKIVTKYPKPSNIVNYHQELQVIVDREKAGFSSWYELFPRSCGPNLQHGTFQDVIDRLPYIANMGFDVLYLPPIHPIGHTFRKGKNNVTKASADDVGSPWAIGAKAGGHLTIHPKLGTITDFKNLIHIAKQYNIEVALDFALQCSPDHPYVKEHPEWFKKRPDGSIQYAENPPKKYQDIYPLNFNNNQYHQLWEESKNIILFWIQHGIKIFRVDNPHTKPFSFWRWLIKEIKDLHADVIFLSEAFTRPKIMYYLAKIGFTQSYTYFTWRTRKDELTRYFTELNQPPISEYFRPNLWPNTPDILHDFLQKSGRVGFIIRLILAATLSSNYGIYGPAFELCISEAREIDSEEYLHSEKYEIKNWDLNQENSLVGIISRINNIRKNNKALQTNNLVFHQIDNNNIICFSKSDKNKSNIIVVLVNLDPHHLQSGWLHLSWQHLLGSEKIKTVKVYDLFRDEWYSWNENNYIELDPQVFPAHILQIDMRSILKREKLDE